MESTSPVSMAPGCLAIGVLVRGVPLQECLLWPFLSHVFLYPRVFPQRPDPWDLKRVVLELWHWMGDIRDENPDPGAIAISLLPWSELSAPVQQATKRLQDCASLSQLIDYVIESPIPPDLDSPQCAKWLADLNAGIGCVFEEVLGLSWRRTFDGPKLKALRQKLRKFGCAVENVDYWLVPIWFFGVLMRESSSQLVNRLGAAPSDERTVQMLIQELQPTSR